jgi:F-type H+-transporting ATPase subunit epsilon
MKLTVTTPTEVLAEADVAKVKAESRDGAFTLLPLHVDIVSALVPGILSYSNTDGEESFMAVDEGILVKCGDDVSVSCMNGTIGEDLAALRDAVEERFENVDEDSRRRRTAMIRLETRFARRYLEFERGKVGNRS